MRRHIWCADKTDSWYYSPYIDFLEKMIICGVEVVKKKRFLSKLKNIGPGAMVGAALYDICIFTGGESPINYPWTRTKRSFKKGKKKWARRLHLNKKKEQPWAGDQLAPWGLEPVGGVS